MGDFKMIWDTTKEVADIYHIGIRDYYFWGLCIAPTIISHFVTIWGHYYRADSIFQRSVSQVSWPASMPAQERKAKRLNALSVWEKHDPYFGYMYKFWVLAVITILLNLAWFFQPIVILLKEDDGHAAVWSYADILTMVIVSRNRLEPLKPYYPGDYVNLQNVNLGGSYHPFTIASYWAEDPYSMTIYIRTFEENKNSWTYGLAQLCGDEGEPVMVQMNIDGVFGDRVHDYLCSDVVVIFAAGAALTTFMPLIKSIAAQIDAKSASLVPQRTIKVHLFSTFRYESELYAYGDFLHQVTNDPRFTSWLKVQIHVSRPDKTSRQLVTNDTANHDRKTRMTRHTDSEETTMDSSSNTSSIEPVQIESAIASHHSNIRNTSAVRSYADRPIPIFPAVNSAWVSTIHAKRDLLMTAAILLIPIGAYIGLRYTPLEGTWNGEWRWCRTTEIYDQNMTNKCMWNYAMTPGFVHIVIASIIGYSLNYYARWSTLRRFGGVARFGKKKDSAVDLEEENPTFAYMKTVFDSQLMAFDGSIQFQSGRLDVKESIQGLIAANIGVVASETTSVFVGGPGSFLDSVEQQSKSASWSVELHRETWSP
ncbi:hypothetical protein BGX28_009298 [Mortierella sp. GBA30]|nr:hypothetical protein BGX28_009298 [Mortierella sp. GBA30]